MVVEVVATVVQDAWPQAVAAIAVLAIAIADEDVAAGFSCRKKAKSSAPMVGSTFALTLSAPTTLSSPRRQTPFLSRG